jgi:3D (Asp-Asp-Asp) domain-containing protein
MKTVMILGLFTLIMEIPKMGTDFPKMGEQVTATIYHAVEGQTDSTPFVTASGKHINPNNPAGHRWIAVSRDLEPLGFVFGCKVMITGAGQMNGVYTVQDRMNKRWTMRIDFLVNESMRGGKWENVTIRLLDAQ